MMMDTQRFVSAVACSMIAAAAMLLTACTGGDAETAASREASEVQQDEPMPQAHGPYWCEDYEVTEEMLAHPRSFAELDERWHVITRNATMLQDVTADPGAWSVLLETEDSLALMGGIPGESMRSGPDGPLHGGDHSLVVIARGAAAAAMPLDSDPEWGLQRYGSCRLANDVSLPRVSLDPEHPPTPDSGELHLLVLDDACGGRIDMPERIEVRAAEETGEAIGLMIGARPLASGAVTCEGFSPTPFTLQLDAPIGDRAVLDLSRPLPYGDMRATLAAAMGEPVA